MSRLDPSTGPTNADNSPSNWTLIQRMLALSWGYRWGCIRLVLLNLVLVSVRIAGLGFFGLGVDYIDHVIRPAETPPPQWPLGLAPPGGWSAMAVVVLVSLLVLLAATLQASLTYGTTLATAKLVNRQIVVDLRSRVYDKMQRLSFRFFDANASSSLINRVTSDVQAVRMFIEMVVVQSIIIALSLAVYLTYMFNIHVMLTLACMLFVPLMWIITVRYSRTVKPAYLENRRLVDRMILRLSENLHGVRVVKGFSLEGSQNERFAESNHEVRDQKQWIFWRASFFVPLIHGLSHLMMVVLLGYGGYLYLDGQIRLGAGLMVFLGLLHQFSNQVGNISNIANSMQVSLVGAQRVFEVLDTPAEITSPPRPTPLPEPRGDVVFENVGFAYEDGEPVLDAVSFHARPNQCVAVLGTTGAGKTTLLSLIPRFYDPTAGRVLIDGHDARQVDLDDLRRCCGMVFQESFLFSNTVAANIAFGHPEATREQVVNAAKIAAAHEFIQELQHGYDTIIGENGIGLSGGQRQRLAIARAVLLEPAILLLDDPTAAIDPETEGFILEAMDRAMHGRTTFVVAHRLSTLRRADYIIVLDKGRIVQQGTHRELMNEDGQYQWAANLQTGDEHSRKLLGLTPGGQP